MLKDRPMKEIVQEESKRERRFEQFENNKKKVNEMEEVDGKSERNIETSKDVEKKQ